MKYFKKMVETVRRVGLLGYKNIGEINKAMDIFNYAVLNNNIFVFTPTGDEQKHIGEVGDLEIEEVDAPFPVFSIELSNDKPLTSSDSMAVSEYRCDVKIWCLLVMETSPKNYTLFELAEVYRLDSGTTNWGVRVELVHPDSFKHPEPANSHLLPLADVYLKRIAREKTGCQKIREKFKVGSGKSKKFHTIRKVIHVTPKSNISDYTYNNGNTRSIDWSHRWNVRGHWMKTKGVGKDRVGNYCVEGFTWRKSHVKGPENLPLIKKQRIVE